MNFNMTDERRMLQETLQRFLQSKYSHEARRQTIASGEAYDKALFGELAELGIISALFSDANGGNRGRSLNHF